MFDSKPHCLRLILVSQSPRRVALLNKWGFKFYKYPIKISEKLNENMNLDCGIQEIARQKSEALKVSRRLKSQKNYLLLSADTLVVFQGYALGKPRSKKEAIVFLQKLSGYMHEVKTGLCLWDHLDKVVTGVETTKVYFKKLRLKDIISYVETGDGLDKAGAYGVQSVKDRFISHIEGSIDNVIGLPRNLLETLLKENGWSVERVIPVEKVRKLLV